MNLITILNSINIKAHANNIYLTLISSLHIKSEIIKTNIIIRNITFALFEKLIAFSKDSITILIFMTMTR